jgi:hypothetical protein
VECKNIVDSTQCATNETCIWLEGNVTLTLPARCDLKVIYLFTYFFAFKFFFFFFFFVVVIDVIIIVIVVVILLLLLL